MHFFALKPKLFIFFAQLILLISCQTVEENFSFETDLDTETEINIGNNLNWKVWLDENTEWQNDTLYLPNEFNLNEIQINPPTCGWESLYQKGTTASLPVCVEELFSKGNPEWSYHGVSWFTTNIQVPETWGNKVVEIYIGKKNSRIEIFVNEKLVGYDIVAGTPYSCNISNFIKPGAKNRIAFRITNPGGQRGWNDFPLIPWGKYKLLPHHDFGGIGGEVKLLINDKVYIDDLFIKNLLPAKANNIEIQASIHNTTQIPVEAQMFVRIKSNKTGLSVFGKSFPIQISASIDTLITKTVQVPKAELWDIDNPNLYTCQVYLKSDAYTDVYNQSFGFRVFEVKPNDKGEENFYLNGKRFRHRSAIDWGYYAHHGYYPDSAMAKKSILNAKSIGHNGINCHRNMADELLLNYADSLGLAILEEPGGFEDVIKLHNNYGGKCFNTFEGQLMIAKCLRMAKRDRNHPSVIGYILANERDVFDLLRKNIMVDMHAIDNSKLIVNQSGGANGGPAGQVPHIRPYAKKFRLDYMDDHTVFSGSRFNEEELNSHQSANDPYTNGIYGRIDPLKNDNIIYWGEVRCYAGPDNSYNITQQAHKLNEGRTGYDIEPFKPLASKIEDYFKQNNLSQNGSKNIKSPSDLTVQAGRGLMYSSGRLDQVIMSNNSMDGFAINGWSGGANKLPPEHGVFLEWYSAIVDEGRNLKGPAEDYKYWNRPLQVAIFRKNGKYFNPGDEIIFGVSLINEGLLKPGEHQINLRVKDGGGNYTNYTHTKSFKVAGGETYAQSIYKEIIIKIPPEWKAGYLTIEGTVTKSKQVLAFGAEQVLLKNRASYKENLKEFQTEVYKWHGAKKALNEAGHVPNKEAKRTVIFAGEIPTDKILKSFLEKTQKGATLIIKFDEKWGEKLFQMEILKQRVTTWGGEQKPFWNGNGWGYIDYFVGNQVITSKSTIGTNSWEVPEDPRGFSPFLSNYPQTSYGAWFARPNTLLTLLGEITYGKGKIILAPSYSVGLENAFSDLLFFNMINLF